MSGATPAGLAAFKAQALGRGYAEKCLGSRGVRDTEHGVDIVVVLTGGFPGDGKPTPVACPDPATTASVVRAWRCCRSQCLSSSSSPPA